MSHAEFHAFLQRLKASDSPQSQNLWHAITVAADAFHACAAATVTKNDLAVAANRIGNAFLCDDRALRLVQKYVLTSPPGVMLTYIKRLVQHGVPYECFTHSLLVYIALKYEGHLSPKDSIAPLTDLFDQLASSDTAQDCDISRLQICLSQQYVILGDTIQAMKCLNTAVLLSKGTDLEDSVLWSRCQIMVDADVTAVEDLRYLRTAMHYDDPEYADICSSLLVVLQKMLGQGGAEDETNENREEIKQEIVSVLKAQEVSRSQSQHLYGPFLVFLGKCNTPNNNTFQKELNQSTESANAADPAAPAPESSSSLANKSDIAKPNNNKKTINVAHRYCAKCGKSADEAVLKTCSRCGNVQYCSQLCQVAHWKHGGHKNVCKKRSPFPYPTDADTAFSRIRQYITTALHDETFIQWWTNMPATDRENTCILIMEDMPKDGEDNSLWCDFGGSFKNLFPELNIQEVCSFSCRCGNCDLHGNVPAVLFQWMYERTVCHQEAADADQRLVRLLYDENNFEEDLLEMAMKSRQERFLQVLSKFVDQWEEVMLKRPTPNLMLRALGCALCGKDAAIYSENDRCNVCRATFWCGEECRQRAGKLHLAMCPKVEQVPHIIRENSFDMNIASASFVEQ